MMEDINEEVVGEVPDVQTGEEEQAQPEAPPEQPPEPPKKHEPPVDSPRWKEVYGKMKEFERQLNDKDETLSAVIEHNKSLQDAMDSLYDKISISERPDPVTDPDGFAQWVEDKASRKYERLQKPLPEKPKQKTSTSIDKIKEQAGVMRSIYPDFEQVVAFANGFIEKDPVKKSDIAFSDNPPRALYEYGLKKKAEISQKREASLNQATVETGGVPPSGKKKVVLTDYQKRVARGLNISEQDYIKQLEIIKKGRG